MNRAHPQTVASLARLRAWLSVKPYRTLALLFAICVLVFLASLPLPRADGMLIGSDGVKYFAYTRSLVVDGDLDFRNEFARLLSPSEQQLYLAPTSTGLVPNAYAIGVGLLWLPFFVAAHLAALLLNGMGYAVSTDGYSYLHQAAVCLGSMLYGFGGLLLTYRIVARYFQRTALTVVVLSWLATNVIYYMIAEPSMPHMCSLFAVALLIERWLTARPGPTLRQWAVMGLTGGLVALVRLPDATYLALPVLDALTRGDGQAVPLPGDPLRRRVSGMIVFGLSAIAVFAPQMAAWQALYGSPFVSGYLYTDQPTFFWSMPQIAPVLFSSWHGLYVWHPVFLLASIGLAWLYHRDRRLAVWLALGLAMQIYVIGAWRDWNQGDAFGGRMFISALPGLALGMGALIEWAFARGWFTAIAWLGAALIVWNGLFMIQYRFGYIPKNAPLTLEQFTVGKLWMLADLWQRLVSRLVG